MFKSLFNRFWPSGASTRGDSAKKLAQLDRSNGSSGNGHALRSGISLPHLYSSLIEITSDDRIPKWFNQYAWMLYSRIDEPVTTSADECRSVSRMAELAFPGADDWNAPGSSSGPRIVQWPCLIMDRWQSTPKAGDSLSGSVEFANVRCCDVDAALQIHDEILQEFPLASGSNFRDLITDSRKSAGYVRLQIWVRSDALMSARKTLVGITANIAGYRFFADLYRDNPLEDPQETEQCVGLGCAYVVTKPSSKLERTIMGTVVLIRERRAYQCGQAVEGYLVASGRPCVISLNDPEVRLSEPVSPL